MALAAMPFGAQATEAGRGGACQQDRSHRLAVNDRRAKLRRRVYALEQRRAARGQPEVWSLQDKEKMARSIDPRRKTSREVQRQNETVPTGWSLRRGIHLGQPPWSGHQQAGHMEANDPIRQNSKLSCKTGPSTYGLLRHCTHCYVRRLWTCPAPARLGLAPRLAGLWVVRASILAPQTKGAQNHAEPVHRSVSESRDHRSQKEDRQTQRSIAAQAP